MLALNADLFRVLGHPVRVRLLELLRPGESNVSRLRDALELDSSATSQHLAALRTQGIVASRRQGTNVYYRLRDPRTVMLLDISQGMALAMMEEEAAEIASRPAA
jgi:ArsR family transcriptional regulator